MEKKGKVMMMWVLFLGLVLSSCCFSGCFAAEQNRNKQTKSTTALFPLDRIGSSVVFPIRGNVYPDGYYYVALTIGNPPKPYFLDIDTGSDLTWLQCDAPCVRCNKAPHPPFRPNKNSLVSCSEPICAALHVMDDDNYKCEDPHDQCDYEVEYADQALSLGVLVRDAFPLRFTNGSIVIPRLGFGCGYDQHVPNPTASKTDGVLGLGNGDSSIVSQLRKLGLTRNVIGHCISGRGGGFLFFGDALVPSSGVVWTPMSRSSSADKHYSPGPAELVYGTKPTGVKGLLVIFDTGSTYTYFNLQAYQALISSVRKDLTKMPLKVVDDNALPVCWKGTKPFKSIQDVKKYFTPVTLSFGKKARFVIPPEAYLIITSNGNVCLGILNGSEVGLENLNIIGDISLQDLLVIYDNEKQQIGWAPKDCNRLPKDRDDEDLFQAYTTNMGILTEQLPPANEEL
ncbi:hypothetical protein AQUCO_01400250v1 [Aquilegia coerulea]|uniref:Aspartic proteinase Asp1 n=1 Tax=Aquilegia coerulea TaxID=218851 RepID=A0A2G5DVC2_AQUCA|nr:hypothetical protein AQUCO_01400250v1 [Aquilegia coerulea]